jgi:hypothetical protein
MRAPWRWQWHRIVGLMLLWSGVTAVCWYAPILWLAVAGWFVLWARSTSPPPVGAVPSLVRKEAGHSVESRYGGAQVTVTVPGETVRVDVKP